MEFDWKDLLALWAKQKNVTQKEPLTSFSCLILSSSSWRLNSLACFSRRFFERARSSSTFSIFRTNEIHKKDNSSELLYITLEL